MVSTQIFSEVRNPIKALFSVFIYPSLTSTGDIVNLEIFGTGQAVI